MKNRNQLVAAFFAGIVLLAGCGQTPQTPPVVEVQPTAEAPTEVSTEATEAPAEEPAEAPVEAPVEVAETALEDGVYSAKFDTDSSMFHVNEVMEGRGRLVVTDGEMRIHIVMPSQNVVNLYYGLAEDAQKDGAELIEPAVETVVYPDGLEEEVYAYDVPVPYLDDEFDVALIGTKGVWYDHKVSVSDPVPSEEGIEVPVADALEDGSYQIDVTLEGGSGRAGITSPAELTVANGEMTLRVEWSSPNYDYMLVDGEKYEPVNTEGNSVFLIPVTDLSQPFHVTGDTVAMSEPHEIEYDIVFDTDSIQ